MRPLLSLVMIVKDESKSIKEVLETAKPFVDRYTILDTGSTDGTQALVRATMAGVPGNLYEEPFQGYAKSRNRVMALDADLDSFNAERAFFQLMLSGDEYLRNGEKLREHLKKHRESDVDCHFVWVAVNPSANRQPRVFRTGSPWHYEDADCGVHEFPAHPEGEKPRAVVEGVAIDHVVADHDRRYDTIWEKHIPLLREALERNPHNERALVLLAQSYESLMPFFNDGEKTTYALEAMSLILRRLAIPTGNEIERNYLEFQLLDHGQTAGVYLPAEVHARAEVLLEKDPRRPEVALLAAVSMMQTPGTPLGRSYALLCRAIKVAERVADIDNGAPVPMDSLWKAHYFAAVVAKQLVKLDEDFVHAAKAHVDAGIKAGGTPEVFSKVGVLSEALEAAQEQTQ